ncbi:MAG: septal ring lytic transglycosylase RlpA family protein [Polaromonas sp.]
MAFQPLPPLRYRLALLAGVAAACVAVLPAQALELSANAAANERNAITQPVLAGNGGAAIHQPITADISEGASLALVPPPAMAPPQADPLPVAQEQGGASWYARYFHGRRTANGERYDQNQLTAAHKTLPFGTVVRVRSEVNGKEVDVRINDRGPFVAGRVIDLSQAAAKALGMLQLGVKRVTLLLPPGLRPTPSAGSAASYAGTPSVPAAGTLPSAQTDAPAARSFTPTIK